MTARAPVDFFAAFDSLPLCDEPLSTEQLADVDRAQAARAAGTPHAEVERKIDARRRSEDG